MNAQIVAATLQRRTPRLVATIAMAVLLSAASVQSAWAQTAPTLGTAQSYGVLAGTPDITNTGISQVNGDLGIHPASAVTDNGTLTVTGATEAGTAAALQAKNDLVTAYNFLDSSGSNPCTFNFIIPTDIGGLSLLPGVYCFSSSAALTGTVPTILVGGPSDVWVFKTVSDLTVGPGSSMVFSTGTVSGGQSCNVFWKIGSSAALDTTAKFIGSILALTSITINTGAIVDGRALARNGTVTMDHNIITPPVCAAEVAPTLSKAFSPKTIDPNGPSTLTITLGNSTGTSKTLTAALTDNLLGIGVTATGSATTTCGGVVSIVAGIVSLPIGATIPAGGCTVTIPVTATVAGDHVNLTSNLLTDHGEAPPAGDTLNVRSTGKLVVTKTTTSGDGKFYFTGDLGPFSITTVGGVNTFTITVPTGTYVINETPKTGWTLTSNGCSSVTVTANGGSCTITNAPVPVCETITPAIAWLYNIPGPPKKAVILATDAGGIKTIKVIASTNLQHVKYSLTEFGPQFFLPGLNIAFTVPGNPTSVYIFATKLNPALGSVIGVKVYDVCANATTFDPFDVTMYPGKPVTVTGVSASETLVQIVNDKLTAMSITVNGQQRIIQLKRDETRTVDIARLMTAPDSMDGDGNPVGHNTIVLEGRGPKGSSAGVTGYPPPAGNKPSRKVGDNR